MPEPDRTSPVRPPETFAAHVAIICSIVVAAVVLLAMAIMRAPFALYVAVLPLLVVGLSVFSVLIGNTLISDDLEDSSSHGKMLSREMRDHGKGPLAT